jgi:cytoskeletal protein RodZ
MLLSKSNIKSKNNNNNNNKKDSKMSITSIPLLYLTVILLASLNVGQCFTIQQHQKHPKASFATSRRTAQILPLSQSQAQYKYRYSISKDIHNNVPIFDTTVILAMSSEEQQNQNQNQKQEQQKDDTSSSFIMPISSLSLSSSMVINTLSVLGLLSAFCLFWSECSILLTKCSPVMLPISMEQSAYISCFLFASGTNLSKIIFGTSMTELLLVDHCDDVNDYGKDNNIRKIYSRKTIEKGLFYATEVVAFMAVVFAFAVVVWQVLQGVETPGSDDRWCQMINE